MAPRINYLNNRDILKEIHKSKTSYCSFLDEEDANHDIILENLIDINVDTITQARKNRSDRLTRSKWESVLKINSKAKLEDYRVDINSIADTDLVFRIKTFDHIPLQPGRKKTPKSKADNHVKINFPPFQHYKLDADGNPYCVGKSHWVGGVQNGYFSKDHGRMTNELARMFMKLCERYGSRGNWRGYCVDDQTEALTHRGWVNGHDLSTNDTILSYDNGQLTWSAIKSIYRDEAYNGLMFHLTSRSIDSLITPGHKIVTVDGIKPVEHLRENDKIVVLGTAEAGAENPIYSDALVELVGWIVTEGCIESNSEIVKRIVIYQNEGSNADKIRNALTTLGYRFSESKTDCIGFAINRADSQMLASLLPNKNISPDFILSLTADQRKLLLNTMILGDGWNRVSSTSFAQKDKARVDSFQMLATLAGKKTNTHYIQNHVSFGKLTNYYVTNLFTDRSTTTSVSTIDMHGGKSGRGAIGQLKEHNPNKPTVTYKGLVWCPETEYGSFVARRNGKVYLTGNSYNAEMQGQALLQLSQVGLQFDESKSQNPFAYYTATLQNSFTRVLNLEKRNQSIRDDILEMNGMNPSYTRQSEWGKGTND